MRRILVAVAWLPAALSFLFVCLVMLSAQSKPSRFTHASLPLFFENDFKYYAALPAVLGSQNSSIITGDARPLILERFIKTYNKDSPLLPYTYFLVDVADRDNLEFSLMTAIAMQESNLCKHIPENSKNCWGLGIYGDKIWRFNTYEEAIEAVGKTLSKYASKGRLQPEEIMEIYTPSSNGSWAHAVRKFMDDMK